MPQKYNELTKVRLIALLEVWQAFPEISMQHKFILCIKTEITQIEM